MNTNLEYIFAMLNELNYNSIETAERVEYEDIGNVSLENKAKELLNAEKDFLEALHDAGLHDE